MSDADAVRVEVERARRVAELLNDPQSRAMLDAYVRELESSGSGERGAADAEFCALI